MVDLFIPLAVTVAGFIFFRKQGDTESFLTLQFPTAETEKGIRTRRNGNIMLAVMVATWVIVILRRQGGSFDKSNLVTLIGAVLVVIVSAYIQKRNKP